MFFFNFWWKSLFFSIFLKKTKKTTNPAPKYTRTQKFQKNTRLFQQARFQMEVYTISLQFESLLLPKQFVEIWVYWKHNCCSVAIEVSSERMWCSQPISTMFLKRLAKETKMKRIKNLHVEIYMKTFYRIR